MRSLKTTVFQLPSEVGFTQASSVIAVVRWSDAESSTETNAFVPLNERALPYLPAVAPAHVAPESVPVLPLPDWSAVVVPMPSSNP